MGLVALQHVGASQARARTCVPCVGRQILNHCAIREALEIFIMEVSDVLWEPRGEQRSEGYFRWKALPQQRHGEFTGESRWDG